MATSEVTGRRDSGPRIVVGVDGSEASLAALRWAVEDAKRKGATVVALYAWHLPAVGGTPFGADVSALLDPDILRDAATAQLDKVMEYARPDPAVTVERRVVMAGAAHALLTEAEGAEELVVGSRGHGGFAGLLLGSVSLQCAHHARCPVVIIHPPAPAGAVPASGDQAA